MVGTDYTVKPYSSVGRALINVICNLQFLINMTKQEQEILKNISQSLRRSLKTSWDRGNLEQWADYANLMKSTIASNVTILETLVAHSTIDPIFSVQSSVTPTQPSINGKDPNAVDKVVEEPIRTPVWKNGRWE